MSEKPANVQNVQNVQKPELKEMLLSHHFLRNALKEYQKGRIVDGEEISRMKLAQVGWLVLCIVESENGDGNPANSLRKDLGVAPDQKLWDLPSAEIGKSTGPDKEISEYIPF